MAQAIFDGISKIIECLDHVEILDVKQLYSEWKDWSMEGDNVKYLAAFNVIGGEPTIADEVVHPYFFLINGWKIKPKEEDHVLIIDGLIYSDDNKNPITKTDGGFTVTVYAKTPVFSDSAINYGEIQQAAYNDMLEEFFNTVLRYNDFQKQSIRDALSIDPTNGVDPTLYSIDTVLNRIDKNTQRFGEGLNNISVNIDTTSIENRIDRVATDIANMRSAVDYSNTVILNISDKIDRVSYNTNNLNDMNSDIEDIKADILRVLDSIT